MQIFSVLEVSLRHLTSRGKSLALIRNAGSDASDVSGVQRLMKRDEKSHLQKRNASEKGRRSAQAGGMVRLKEMIKGDEEKVEGVEGFSKKFEKLEGEHFDHDASASISSDVILRGFQIHGQFKDAFPRKSL